MNLNYLNFDRHRYLLHLVPVGKRYLMARKLGLFVSQPILSRRPDFEAFYPLEFVKLHPSTMEECKLGRSVMNWFEDLYKNEIDTLYLCKRSKFPFISLNASTLHIPGHEDLNQNNTISFTEENQCLLPIQSHSSYSDLELTTSFTKHDNELDDCAMELTELFNDCISFSKKHPTSLREWEMSLQDAREILSERKAPFSDYLYLQEHEIPRSIWMNLIPCRDRALAQTLFQICIDYPLLMKSTFQNQSYIEKMSDAYLNLVKCVGNAL